MIAGVVLAAGSGRRFGSQKLLHDVDGRPMLLCAVTSAMRSRLDEVHVVVARGDRAVGDALAAAVEGVRMTVVHENGDPERGMMSSLKIALGALVGRASAAVVMHGDMPRVTAGLIDALIAAHERTGGIVVPVSGGQWRHPRVIPARLFPEFLELADDERGTTVLERYEDDIVRVSGGCATFYLDVDTPGDLDLLHSDAGGLPSRS